MTPTVAQEAPEQQIIAKSSITALEFLATSWRGSLRGL